MTKATDAALLLLGKDYGEYGALCSVAVGAHAAAAISVGTDPASPSHQFKTDPRVKNEDGLCVLDGDDWSGYAVADAHYGPESSHLLLSRLHHMWASDLPGDFDELAAMIADLRHGAPAETGSETTLLVVVYQRTAKRGFGISFGDSSFTILGPGRSGDPINVHDQRYVRSADEATMRNGAPFTFEAKPGELLLLHTDGVDECHYRQPATSVRPSQMLAAAETAGHDPLRTVEGIARLALGGVAGNPGGQDNIAAITAAA